jgi:hypothetical protein
LRCLFCIAQSWLVLTKLLRRGDRQGISTTRGESLLGRAYFSVVGKALQVVARKVELYLRCALSSERIASRTDSAAIDKKVSSRPNAAQENDPSNKER